MQVALKSARMILTGHSPKHRKPHRDTMTLLSSSGLEWWLSKLYYSFNLLQYRQSYWIYHVHLLVNNFSFLLVCRSSHPPFPSLLSRPPVAVASWAWYWMCCLQSCLSSASTESSCWYIPFNFVGLLNFFYLQTTMLLDCISKGN